MIVYIPTPITSVEQAEALPEGTIITHAEDYPQEKFAGLWVPAGNSSESLAEEEGWTALVPIEAHTQDHAPSPGWGERVRRHRYVTAWLPGPSRGRKGDAR